MIHRARVILIECGKMLPFIVCCIVLLSYAECLLSLVKNDYVYYDGSLVLNKPISWEIGKYFEYNLTTVVILLIISVAIETCVWNKMAILYLALQLVEKDLFSTIELYPEYIYAIIAVNLLCSGFFVFKGITILFRKNN